MSSGALAPSVPVLALRGVVRRWLGPTDPTLVAAEGPAALAGCTLQVRAGEVVAVTGPAAAGKSALLLVAAGRVAPTAGLVRWADADTPTPVRPQLVGARPWEYGMLTVRQALAFHADRLRGTWPDHRPPARFVPVLARVGLRGAARTRLGALEPLDAFRVVVAQALLAAPRLLCCDEPFAFLGPAEAVTAARLLRDLAGEGIGVLVASRDHAAVDVAAVADRVLRLERGRLLTRARRTQLALDLAVGRPVSAARRLAVRLPSVRRRGRTLRVPLAGRSPEAVLALCREAGVEVRGSQVAETPV